MAKNCKTTCTGTNNSSGATCGVVGFGSTTFLGGCTKACRFARQDADTMVAFGRILDDVLNAETGQRGFLLTGGGRVEEGNYR